MGLDTVGTQPLSTLGAARALCTGMWQDGVCWGGGWKGGVRKSWQIGADCPIIVDNKAFQQGHKSMADGDTMGGGY